MKQDNNEMERKKYSYLAFGIRIDSEIMLPDLLPADSGEAEVCICYGDDIYQFDKHNTDQDRLVVYDETVILYILNTAAYGIINCEKIVVQLHEQADMRDVRLYLIGTVMGVLLMQRGRLPIHGSLVVVDGYGQIFAGAPGAGKSTMAAALYKQGYAVLADDMFTISCDENGAIWAQPGYSRQKLCEDSAEMLGFDTSELERLSGDWNKCAVSVTEGFSNSPVRISAFYEIVKTSCDEVSIMPLTGMGKLVTIMENVYGASLLSYFKQSAAIFKKCADFSKQVPAFRIKRPENGMSLQQQLELVLGHCRDRYSKNLITNESNKQSIIASIDKKDVSGSCCRNAKNVKISLSAPLL